VRGKVDQKWRKASPPEQEKQLQEEE